MIPGEIEVAAGDIELNAGRETVTRRGRQHAATGRSRSARTTTSSRPTTRSHSTASRRDGFRLDIAAGTAVRFEPGQTRTVELVALAGDRVVYGFAGKVMGAARNDEDLAPGLCRDVRPDRRATACGSPTPSCGSRSSRTSPSTARK